MATENYFQRKWVEQTGKAPTHIILGGSFLRKKTYSSQAVSLYQAQPIKPTFINDVNIVLLFFPFCNKFNNVCWYYMLAYKTFYGLLFKSDIVYFIQWCFIAEYWGISTLLCFLLAVSQTCKCWQSYNICHLFICLYLKIKKLYPLISNYINIPFYNCIKILKHYRKGNK